MIPTVAQIFNRARYLLDDVDEGSPQSAPTYDVGVVFTDAMLQNAFSEAYDVIYAGFLELQGARIKHIQTYTLPPLTTELSPETAGIANFGELMKDGLRERINQRYVPLNEWDVLPQHPMLSVLQDFVWRLDKFFFVGSTQQAFLQITYYSSGTAPDDPAASVEIDGSLNAFAYLTAGIAGKTKGHVEADGYWIRAVGAQFTPGQYDQLGGELSRLLGPTLRAKQRVQIQPRPYSVSRYPVYPWANNVNIAASPAGTGEMPITMTYSDGTITGTLDGVNDTFVLSVPCTTIMLMWNGVTLQPGIGYNHTLNIVVFQPGYIPQSGDSIQARGWTGS